MKELKLHTHREVTINARLWNLLHSLSKGAWVKAFIFGTQDPQHTFFDSYGHSSIFKKRNEAPFIASYIF